MSRQMRIITLVTVLAVLLVFSSACSSQNEVKIGIEADGSQVEMRVGQILVLTLESNPTTGYGWQVTEIDEAVLKQEGDPLYQESSQSQGLVGGGGTETFRFTAVAPGQTTLQLDYQRSFEEDVAPVQTFSVTVLVK